MKKVTEKFLKDYERIDQIDSDLVDIDFIADNPLWRLKEIKKERISLLKKLELNKHKIIECEFYSYLGNSYFDGITYEEFQELMFTEF